MNTIGIDRNLDRARIKKLLTIGLFASILTGIGDFILGYADSTAGGSTLAASVMAGAANLADWQMIAGGLLGFFGIFLEGLAFFAIYRLMADAAPRYAHLYRAGIFGYIWLAPVGCHMNVGVLNLSYKHLLQADAALAEKAAGLLVLRPLRAGLSAADRLLAADDDRAVPGLFQGTDALPEEGEMVLHPDRRDPFAGIGCDLRSGHCPRRGHRHDVFELRQCVHVRRIAGHDAVKNTNATFGWGTKSGREYLELEPRMTLVSETSYNEEMKKYTIRGKLFAIIGKNMNNRLAVFKW